MAELLAAQDLGAKLAYRPGNTGAAFGVSRVGLVRGGKGFALDRTSSKAATSGFTLNEDRLIPVVQQIKSSSN